LGVPPQTSSIRSPAKLYHSKAAPINSSNDIAIMIPSHLANFSNPMKRLTKFHVVRQNEKNINPMKRLTSLQNEKKITSQTNAKHMNTETVMLRNASHLPGRALQYKPKMLPLSKCETKVPNLLYAAMH